MPGWAASAHVQEVLDFAANPGAALAILLCCCWPFVVVETVT